MRVLVTGASGFVGSAVVRLLAADPEFSPIAAVRRAAEMAGAVERVVGDLGPRSDWRDALVGVDAVVHCAARAHQLDDRSPDPVAEFRRINTDGTRRLAQQAAEQGVRRFIFVSSIKVNGEATSPGSPFTEADAPAPNDPYGISKLEAERVLGDVTNTAGMEVVIIRPPLVYGPGVKGNLRRLMGWIARGVPLPLASVRNARSLVALDNLASAIVLALAHPAAAGRTYLISDQQDLSTPDLIRTIAAGMGLRAPLWPMPVALLRAAGALAGKGDEVARLTGSLVVDSGLISRELGWRPPRTPQEGLEQMARSFRQA
jgi:nucleoside-diphosphate-sugar epimerase